MPKYCVLEDDKLCTNCGRCNMCDLDPEKVCYNCMALFATQQGGLCRDYD